MTAAAGKGNPVPLLSPIGPVAPVATEQGVMVGAGVMTRFLGIYSGRINAESDLGFVWKAAAIQQLVSGIV